MRKECILECSSLTRVVFPDSVVEITENAFEGCPLSIIIH